MLPWAAACVAASGARVAWRGPLQLLGVLHVMAEEARAHSVSASSGFTFNYLQRARPFAPNDLQ